MIAEHAVDERTARKLIAQLLALEIASLAFCRLLERWARGDADPSTPGRRQAALRRAADRVETALAGLEQPLGRYLLELEADSAEGRSWFGEPSRAELVDWEPVLDRAGVKSRRIASRPPTSSSPCSCARSKASPSQVRWQSTVDRGSLWAGLFDLRENLLGRAVDDLRAIAA